MEIQHFSHDHTLTCRMVSDKETVIICNVCTYQISEPAYTCGDCSFWLHKSCSELPEVIENHPFHSTHSLVLEDDKESYFICDGCGQLSSKYRFVCKECTFTLDIKCASLTDKEVQASTGCGDVKTTISHFSHNHQLTRCIIRKPFEFKCVGCKEVISGIAYACLGCQYFIHETCLDDMPQEIKHSFHAHRLLPKTIFMSYYSVMTCDACCEDIWGICFGCFDCKFYIHVSCAKYQTRAIKHEVHEHNLLYFTPRNIGRCRKCHCCGESCSASFFCCVDCQFDIHLECLALPLIVKHNRHFHQLTLMDSIVEDDLEQYYCDICEIERNPEHHVYYCQECNYVAHIDCVISKVEPPDAIYSYLIPRLKKVVLEQGKVDNESDNQTLGEELDIATDQKVAQDKLEDDSPEAFGEQDEETAQMLDEVWNEAIEVKRQMEAQVAKLITLRKKRFNILRAVRNRINILDVVSYYHSSPS